MSWQQTHRRWRAIRDVEAEIHAGPAGVLPWNDRYAELFGSRAELVRALEYRWSLIVDAQLDPELPEDTLAETFREITLRHAPLLGVLDAYSRRSVPEGVTGPEGASEDVRV